MTFNEFGHVIAARENGPLILITDEDEDGQYEKIRTYCDKVTNCQGILALNGNVFVTGQGPDGSGLYRLEDEDEDGVLESVKTLIEFEGKPGEHGAHGLTFGPDGLIYLVLGNHVHPKVEYEPNSPYRDHYEGDLLTPRYEDPGGHAVGIKAPGGVVLRTDVQGTSVQVVAGGLRNAYDLAFNADGELFVHDSDMESDEGTTWYRPTKVFHVTEGSEFGWRSGWAKWNEHFVDTLPATVDTGRGSPTGATFYNHFMFPHRYHGVGFFADWSEGRILAVKFKRQGATYTANSEVFLQGSPLNVTDVEVGHDGWLYFVTGGRASGGSLYRVKWRGDVPDDITQIGGGIAGVIRQPQIQSAYARQQIAGLKAELGADWTKQVVGVALSADNPPEYRTRAMDLLQLFGPAPTPKLLVDLSLEPNEQVRAKAAALMGMNPDERTHLR
ncbi:MAG TPA: heme-binding protein, partial [Planctomycetaceae bacterium]|nr:heme-binding protein [Planctomycetaceae bacterium]